MVCVCKREAADWPMDDSVSHASTQHVVNGFLIDASVEHLDRTVSQCLVYYVGSVR